MEFEKLEENGLVAVLFSPGFGAGWYSWNKGFLGLLFDKDIVQQVLNGDNDKAIAIAEQKYPGVYTGGGEQLAVAWIPKGYRFEVTEYDGGERVRVFSPEDGFVA